MYVSHACNVRSLGGTYVFTSGPPTATQAHASSSESVTPTWPTCTTTTTPAPRARLQVRRLASFVPARRAVARRPDALGTVAFLLNCTELVANWRTCIINGQLAAKSVNTFAYTGAASP